MTAAAPARQCRALLEGLGQCPNPASTRVRTPAGFSEFGVCDLHVDEAERHGLCLDVHEPDDSRFDVDPDPLVERVVAIAKQAEARARDVLCDLHCIEVRTEIVRDASAPSTDRDRAAKNISTLNYQAIRGVLEIAKLCSSILRARC